MLCYVTTGVFAAALFFNAELVFLIACHQERIKGLFFICFYILLFTFVYLCYLISVWIISFCYHVFCNFYRYSFGSLVSIVQLVHHVNCNFVAGSSIIVSRSPYNACKCLSLLIVSCRFYFISFHLYSLLTFTIFILFLLTTALKMK